MRLQMCPHTFPELIWGTFFKDIHELAVGDISLYFRGRFYEIACMYIGEDR